MLEGALNKSCVACILLMSILMACGSGSYDVDGVRIIFWHAMGGPLGEMLEDSLIADFNAGHPGIEIIPVCMGNYRALSQKIMASVMAGDPPDLAQAYETWTAQLIGGEVLVPLDSLMRVDTTFTPEMWEDIYPVFRDNSTFDGRIYSFPFNKSVPVIYYNRELFNERSLQPAGTWEEHRELLMALTLDGNHDGDLNDEEDRWGTAFTSSVWMFECLLAQAGGTVLNEAGTATGFSSPEGIAALDYLVSLIHTDRTAYLSTGFEHQREFAAGRVALVQGSVTSLAFMERDMQRRRESGLSSFTIGIAPLPAGEERAVFIAGTNVILFRQGDPARIDAAWEFIKWFTEPEQQARWFAGSGYLPARQSSLLEAQVTSKIAEYPGLQAVLEQLDCARFEPQIIAWYDGREFLSEAVEIALYGRMTAGEALSRAAELADAEIESTR